MKHCATFTDALLPVAFKMLDSVLPEYCYRVLDPFAGTGKGVQYLRDGGVAAVGVELEPEWAQLSPHVVQGSALALPFKDGAFDAVFTSPTYGNRMADRDLRPSVAGTYAKSLGRLASPDSSCHLQWGVKYKEFHIEAWMEAKRVLRAGGYFLLNCKDHVRAGRVERVTQFHAQTLQSLGFTPVRGERVRCPGLRNGRNGEARVDHEWLVLFQNDGA
jgi:SAM-dependent methyltransferase